jgi:hypothetical protein
MLNYLVWRNHEEVELPAVGTELEQNEDEDQMDEMITTIGMEYELASREQALSPEVQDFYKLLAASNEKMHDGIDVTIL